MDGMVPDYLIRIKVESESINSSFRKVAVRVFRAFIKKSRSLLDELLDIICNCYPKNRATIAHTRNVIEATRKLTEDASLF